MSTPDPRLNEWIRTYTPGLLGVARAFAAGEDEAEDLLQEVWIVACERADRRPEGMPLGAWLHRVALNMGRSRRRRRVRRERLRAYWLAGAERAHTSADPAPPPSDRSALWRAVAELPRLQREVVLLRVVEELSTAATAAALGRAEGTVKASLHRALATLRDRLGTEPSR